MSSIAPHHRRRLTLLFVGGLAAALGLAVVSPAVAGKPSGGSSSLPAPVSIVVDRVTSDFTRGGELPPEALPSVVVKAGGTIRVDVHFEDADGAPAAFKKDTALSATSSVGSLGPVSGKALKGSSVATLVTSVTTAVNRVVLTVGAGSGPSAPTGGATVAFDVLSELRPDVPATSGTSFEEGIGGGKSCTTAEPSAPVCGIVRLPREPARTCCCPSAPATRSRTPTTSTRPATRDRAGLGARSCRHSSPSRRTHYSTTSPATIIVKCDKTLCGTGAIKRLTVLYSLTGNDPLTAPEPCPAKGTMAQEATPCVDYVQSKRDGSGDTHLFLLTDRDIRTGIG